MNCVHMCAKYNWSVTLLKGFYVIKRSKIFWPQQRRGTYWKKKSTIFWLVSIHNSDLPNVSPCITKKADEWQWYQQRIPWISTCYPPDMHGRDLQNLTPGVIIIKIGHYQYLLFFRLFRSVFNCKRHELEYWLWLLLNHAIFFKF